MGMNLPDRRALVAVSLTLVLAAGAAIAGTTTSARLDKQGSVYSLERGRTVYRFDAAWRSETVWTKDASGTWQRVDHPAPARVAELRGVFLARLRCESIGSVPIEGKTEMKAVASLGYL